MNLSAFFWAVHPTFCLIHVSIWASVYWARLLSWVLSVSTTRCDFRGFWFSTKIGTVFLLFWSVVLIIFSEEAVALFRKDPDVIAIGIKALRYQMIVFPACSFMMMANVTVKQKCARTIRTHFCFYKITTNSRTAVILPSSASFEDRALSFHLEYGGTYARSFNHISLFS